MTWQILPKMIFICLVRQFFIIFSKSSLCLARVDEISVDSFHLSNFFHTYKPFLRHAFFEKIDYLGKKKINYLGKNLNNNNFFLSILFWTTLNLRGKNSEILKISPKNKTEPIKIGECDLAKRKSDCICSWVCPLGSNP